MRSLVAFLLRMFPAPFRRRFGGDLLATFEDSWRERAGWRLALRTIADLSACAVLEHAAQLRERQYRRTTIEDRQGDGQMNGFLRELRFGWRALRRSPGYSLAAILTLTLGIGATTAIYSVVNAVLVKGLPYPHPERLVFINEAMPKSEMMNVSWLDFVDWRQQNRSFTAMAVMQINQTNLMLASGPRSAQTAWVSSAFFDLLGAKAAMGRTFDEQDDRPSAVPVAVVSYRFWRNQLKGDPSAIGKPLASRTDVFTLVGVLAPGFDFQPSEFDLYVPVGLKANNARFGHREDHPGLQAIAEMRAGVSLARARSDMNTIMQRLAQAYPASDRGETATVEPFAKRLVGDVRSELLLLLGAVLFVLLIACANVAHLGLARAAGRRREFAIRAAIGAGRGRLTAQVLAENLLLTLIGGGLGLAAAHWGVPVLTKLYPAAVPGLKDAGLDSSVLLFTAGVSMVSCLIFGLAPMLQAGRVGLSASMAEGMSGRRGRRTRAVLFVAEIAIAIVVTVGAGLLLRSLMTLLSADPGFRPDHLLAIDVVRGDPSGPANLAFFSEAIERISHQPGVVSAAAIMSPPLLGWSNWSSPFLAEGRADVPDTQKPWTALNMASPGYFQTAGIRLVEGRYFTSSDDAHSTNVAIVNQALARRVWPDGSAVGKRVHVKYAEGELLQVVGVIADVKQGGLESTTGPEVFVPMAQMPVNFMTILVRTSANPETLSKPVTETIHDLDKRLPATKVTPMMAMVTRWTARRKFSALLLGLFSGLAILLAAVGVSGVMAYTVAQRMREFGIRVAVGAQRGQVLLLVLKDGMRLTALGVAIGLGASWGLSRLLTSMLYRVNPHDGLTFAAAPVLLAVVAVVACLLPARMAAKVDPMRALRQE